ncbi:MAG: nucleotidyltransferase [Bacteroidales bacterium]
MKPTLFVLAAGMGSRYGGLKQLDGLGPNGETIMDYSIYDAVRAGFGKVVFVIRHTFEQDFRDKIVKKYESVIPVEIVFQELDYLPEGFTLNPERVKPWGTNHAVLMGKDVIKEPFAVINADDFYGRESFQILADYLTSMTGKTNDYCMIGYRVGNTLSESGAVARGVSATDEEGYLTTVVERTHIERIDGQVMYKDDAGEFVAISDHTPVSMNMWGFTPDYFDYSEKDFIDFLKNNSENLKAEYFIPLMVNKLIQEKTIKLKVLDTPSKWFGVTYADDRDAVVAKINALIVAGEYPEKLW